MCATHRAIDGASDTPTSVVGLHRVVHAFQRDALVPQIHHAHFRVLAHMRLVTAGREKSEFVGSRNAMSQISPAIMKLATSRFKSHSHGPGAVSSKSFKSKISARSGVAKPPKLAK